MALRTAPVTGAEMFFRRQPPPNRQATRFNAEVAENSAKGRKGRAFSAELRANLGVLGVIEIIAEHDEVGR